MAIYGERAQLVTPKMLKFLEEYIEVPFSMPKLGTILTLKTFYKDYAGFS